MFFHINDSDDDESLEDEGEPSPEPAEESPLGSPVGTGSSRSGAAAGRGPENKLDYYFKYKIFLLTATSTLRHEFFLD